MEISPQEREWFAREIHDARISLYRLALSITGDPHEAEEAVAEAVYRAYVKFYSLRDREKFHSWILKITANAARALPQTGKDNLPGGGFGKTRRSGTGERPRPVAGGADALPGSAGGCGAVLL